MKKRYIVGVREVHVRHYAVTAKNEDEAMNLVRERASAVEDIGFSEYSHELDRGTWSVEESSENESPDS